MTDEKFEIKADVQAKIRTYFEKFVKELEERKLQDGKTLSKEEVEKFIVDGIKHFNETFWLTR